MKLRGLLLPVLLGFAGSPAADEVRAAGIVLEPRISIGDDFQMGLWSGWGTRTWEGRYLAFILDAEVRPVSEGVRVRTSPSFEYQFQEIRWAFGPGIAFGQYFTDALSWRAALGASYSDAYYQGTNREPRSGWVGWSETGLSYNLSPGTYCGTAIHFRPYPGLFPARLQLACGYQFGRITP